MLVLSRKIGESVVIDGRVIVTIQEMRGGRVRLSFQAPADVPVLREELVGQPPSASEWVEPVIAREQRKPFSGWRWPDRLNHALSVV
jgi:carbon storage regulator